MGSVRVHKFNYQKMWFREDSGLAYQEGLSERELATLNGLSRVWGLWQNTLDKGYFRVRYGPLRTFFGVLRGTLCKMTCMV